ncbi:MAG: hypothetical protein HC827_02895 [Cyanobacteria bacterium RM1_2_2]|nr:hypothetical protein [Cyanobacteria bacterium RM1_2_2]
MANQLGFGKPQAQPKVSKRAAERAKAAQQYDQMRTDGTPDFEVYIRIQGKKNWCPVGVIAVKRSNQIVRAIFDSREELLQGAFRLYPILRKHQNQLEYGYRLKEFKDDPIQVATLSQSPASGVAQNVFAQVKERVAALLKRS